MEWIYPILGKQKCLPFYLSGIGIAEPEYHVIREEGLVSHQLHYTQSGRGNLVVGGATYPLEPGSMFYMAPGIPHEYYPLVEDGEIKLEDDITTYLPKYSALKGVTIEKLLHQTTGIKKETMLDQVKAEGKEGIYQNAYVNYSILGELIESVSGETYEE